MRREKSPQEEITLHQSLAGSQNQSNLANAIGQDVDFDTLDAVEYDHTFDEK